MTDDTTDDEQTDDARWTLPSIIRREAPGVELTGPQKQVLAAAVRNPDTTVNELTRHIDLDGGGAESTSAGSIFTNVVRKVKYGGYDVDDYDPRLNRGPRDWKELTVKQRACLDFLARHPDAYDELTFEGVADHIERDTGVPVSYSTPYNVKRNHPDMLVKRREWYEQRDPGAIGPVEPDDDDHGDGRANRLSIRDRLGAAGVTDLPDENLDGLPTMDEITERKHKAIANARKQSTSVSAAATASAADDIGAGADPKPVTTSDDRVETGAGMRRFSGGAIDLTTGRAPSYLADVATKQLSEDVGTAAVDALRDENGELGERAHVKDVSIDDRDALESELKQVRLLISTQAAVIKQLQRALDHIEVDVAVRYTPPEPPRRDADRGDDA